VIWGSTVIRTIPKIVFSLDTKGSYTRGSLEYGRGRAALEFKLEKKVFSMGIGACGAASTVLIYCNLNC
jgi:hypothetical protein